ncbi:MULTISPECIES: hypothetical protein [unclassified Duganella]|uniref:hypothetical protein n=1 Tax=unclassified Duganella TaxID=2636909 RepID=UPI000891ABD0|nr:MULTISPECIES: hypothetical protein [unclassified Duganella]SDH49137.1 hypothetical protein SAMN05216320_11438 [Duganella sp. OV458]SDK64207.1 hypothetical protein SAMN05428973_11462 [Duganella sp. OV510]
MAKTEQTTENLKVGVSVEAGRHTTIQLLSPKIEILIGGPYKAADGMHTYGHMALRVSTTKQERVYDFGRYGRTNGEFSATGDGILRVWSDFGAYISGENAYGRVTRGFSYNVTDEQAIKIFSHYEQLTASATKRRAAHPKEEEFKLAKEYHAITNNCATMSLAGARLALPSIDAQASRYNEGRGMSEVEKIAARGSNFGFWPSHIFMPADVQAMLETEKKSIPSKIESYGKGRK